MGRWVVVAGGGVALCAGCLLTSDFDGIAGTRPPDGGVAIDAGDDAADAADSGAFPCTPGAHLLCTNFDTGSLDSTGWVVERSGAAPLARLDTKLFDSPPAGFHSTIGMAAKTVRTGAIIRQTPAIGAFKTLIYAFDMNVQSCASLGMSGSVTLAVLQPSDAVAFGLVLLDTNVYSFARVDLVAGKFQGEPFTVAPKMNTWQHVVIRLAFNASAAHASVMLDGNQVVDVDETPGPPNPSILLNLGANATGPIAGCDVVYDNVTFDKQ